MVLIIYEYVGEKFRCWYHENYDLQLYEDETDWKKALIRFWAERSPCFCKKERRNHKNDFKIKNILTSDSEIKEFVKSYWANEPACQELWLW